MEKEINKYDTLRQENFALLQSYDSSLSKYKVIMNNLREQNLMTEAVKKSAKQFEGKILSINKVIKNKDNLEGLELLLPKLPTIIKNIDNTNGRLNKYYIEKLSSSFTGEFDLGDLEKEVQEEEKIVEEDDVKIEEEEHNKKLLIIFLLILAAIGILFASIKGFNSSNTENNSTTENNQSNPVITQEESLLKKAIDESTSEAINEFIELFPNHYSLKEITLNPSSRNNTVVIKGVNSSNISVNKIDGKYLIPEGCKIHAQEELLNNKTNNKYFTVSENKTINLAINYGMGEVLNKNFMANSNSWNQPNSYQNMTISTSNGYKLINNSPYNFSYVQQNSSLTKSDDYKIDFNYSTNPTGRVYLLFGGTKDAFTYFAFDNADNTFKIGHHNFNDDYTQWKAWSADWGTNGKVRNGNSLTVIKKGSNMQFYIGKVLVFEDNYKKYYGNKIGVGIAGNTALTLKSLKTFKFANEAITRFKKGEVYYCGKLDLEVFANPNKHSVIIHRITPGESVKYLGERKNKVQINYLGVPKNDYYYQVELTNGTKGWVHGGGLNEI